MFRLPIKAAGVNRIAVGIGKKIDESELESIAGDKSRVVNAKDFGDLDNQLDDIREKTCSMYFVCSVYSLTYCYRLIILKFEQQTLYRES